MENLKIWRNNDTRWVGEKVVVVGGWDTGNN